MTNEEAKESILRTIMGCEISLYTTLYGPNEAVVPISNLCSLIPDLTKYRARKALKALIADGLVCYKSQGMPAIVSCGEVPELVCESSPPINGYTMTKTAFESEMWKQMKSDWEKSMEEWANGYEED